MTDTTTPATDPNNVAITSYQQGQVTNPTLPANTTLTPVLQQVQNGELMTGTNSTLDPNGAKADPIPAVTNQQVTQTNANATQVDPNAVNATSGLNSAGNTYDATKIGDNAAQGVAAQGTVSTLSTMQGQLAQLYAGFGNGQTPAWAQGALNLANEQMASRGMGASSIGAAAMVSAVQASAIQIAAQDASTYFNMDMKNLDNSQQMALQNVQNKQQAMLSDQAADNASKQFNASSAQQMQQFMASMVQNIMTQNADRTTAISQFNAGQANTISATNASNSLQSQEFNAQQQSAIEQFNASLKNQRDTFNATNAFAIEQSNVTWRRNLNTANTASVNAANQVNTQNAFNLSATALNNVWQQFRDESSWIFQAGQNQNTINANIAMAANAQDYLSQQLSDQQNTDFLGQIAEFAGKLLIGA